MIVVNKIYIFKMDASISISKNL